MAPPGCKLAAPQYHRSGEPNCIDVERFLSDTEMDY